MRIPLFTHRFTLTGLNLERFLNAMLKAGIPLLEVRRQGTRAMTCRCFSADLKAVVSLAQEKGWRIGGVRPLGLSAAGLWLRRRPGIAAGVLLSMILVGVLSQFVWRVEVRNAGPYRAEIEQYLQSEGYSPGLRRAEVDASALESALTRRYPEVAWFQAYVYNVTLVVDVALGVAMPQLPSNDPSHVVAQCDGIVDSVRVYAGTAAVKAGDVVRQGDVLIRGEERGANGETVAVHARGVVMARCWRSYTVRMSLNEAIATPTGREHRATQLVCPWLAWPEEPDAPPFLTSDLTVTLTPIAGAFIPLWQRTLQWNEVALEYRRRDEAQVRAQAGQAALSRLKESLYGYELVDKWVDYCMIEDTTLAATATAEWLMDIGGGEPP